MGGKPTKIQSTEICFETIKDSVRNFRSLTDTQLEYIKKLSVEDKFELFKIYNECMKSFNSISF